MKSEKCPPPVFRLTRAALFFAGTLTATFAAVPAANAMVASVYESAFGGRGGTATETHNTEASDYVASVWNRTLQLNGGTGTYLGQGADGTYYILTAAHVSTTGSVSLTTSSGVTYKYTTTGTATKLTQSASGSSVTYADLQVVAITSSDSAALDYLTSLGSIGIYENSISTNTELYTVGTGKSCSIGDSYASSTASRQKEWALFYRNDLDSESSWDKQNGSYKTTCYVEIFSNQKTSFQGCSMDSGSGVFVCDADVWYLAGVLLYVAGNANGATTIGYSENASSGEYIYATFFADLSVYADQISAIMAIPEPSAFGLLAGTLSLAVVAARRRRK